MHKPVENITFKGPHSGGLISGRGGSFSAYVSLRRDSSNMETVENLKVTPSHIRK
jgi:hypothetical protein